jgi:mono/diheme cytochrome c family protein
MARKGTIEPSDLGVTKLLWVFAALSILLTCALAIVPARARATEWRRTQVGYNTLAAKLRGEPIEVAIQQIWKPELGVADRCPTCHLGMGGRAEPLARRLFAEHPAIPHEVQELGCTICHGGQGAATTANAAHGRVAHWDDPMLERGTYEAGCGGCHSHIRVPRVALARVGRTVFEGSKCRSCHRVDGTGGVDGPDLSTVGLRDHRTDWHSAHMARSAEAAETDRWVTQFAPLADDEVLAVDEYLHGLVGAPRLMEGKTLAHELGCRGCHRIGGVGGDDGPDLSNEGRRLPADLDFSNVPGRRTLPNWLAKHFLDPARVVRGSRMPNLALSAEQAGGLALYMLSLRATSIPESLAPRDRVRGARLAEREFATDGESLYGVFCAACHGSRGEGKRFGDPEVTFPAVGNADFLAIADPAFLRDTLTRGRPGRRMPPWGTKDGGLRPQEIDALVEYLKGMQPVAPTFEEVMAQGPDPEEGRGLFARQCSTCHGEAGEGTALAPPLAAEDNPATKSDNALYGTLTTGVAGTAMGSFRRLDARGLRAVIATVRALPLSSATRAGWAVRPGNARRGGRTFARVCAECHGEHGEGLQAPALANQAFLSAASDGYLAATIVRGRAGTRMLSFGDPPAGKPRLAAAEVADVVAFLRSLAPSPRRADRR